VAGGTSCLIETVPHRSLTGSGAARIKFVVYVSVRWMSLGNHASVHITFSASGIAQELRWRGNGPHLTQIRAHFDCATIKRFVRGCRRREEKDMPTRFYRVTSTALSNVTNLVAAPSLKIAS
jgi:hypothetical protein